MKISPQSSGSKCKKSKKWGEAGGKQSITFLGKFGLSLKNTALQRRRTRAPWSHTIFKKFCHIGTHLFHPLRLSVFRVKQRFSYEYTTAFSDCYRNVISLSVVILVLYYRRVAKLRIGNSLNFKSSLLVINVCSMFLRDHMEFKTSTFLCTLTILVIYSVACEVSFIWCILVSVDLNDSMYFIPKCNMEFRNMQFSLKWI
jgi:hypothetical protein